MRIVSEIEQQRIPLCLPRRLGQIDKHDCAPPRSTRILTAQQIPISFHSIEKVNLFAVVPYMDICSICGLPYLRFRRHLLCMCCMSCIHQLLVIGQLGVQTFFGIRRALSILSDYLVLQKVSVVARVHYREDPKEFCQMNSWEIF